MNVHLDPSDQKHLEELSRQTGKEPGQLLRDLIHEALHSEQNLDLCYAVLGLNRQTATLKDVEQAFKKAALKNHPDKNKDDRFAEGRFRPIKVAYETLCAIHGNERQ